MYIVTKGLYKIYRSGAKEVRAVNGIDLEIKDGVSAAITGPSGAGKSTLLHMIGALDNPTRGNISIDGVDIYKLSDKERAKTRNEKIGFVFQFYHLLPEFTALENVMMPGLMNRNAVRCTPYAVRERAISLLKSAGLAHRIDHKPSELSGGEAQRVAIARALINEPRILLCDEPTGNLDSKTSESILELLFSLKLKQDLTLIIVTHDDKISSRASHTIRLKDGRVI